MPISPTPSMSTRHEDPARLLSWLATKLQLCLNIDMGTRVELSQAADELFPQASPSAAKPSFRMDVGHPIYDSTSEADVTDEDFAFAIGLVLLLEHDRNHSP